MLKVAITHGFQRLTVREKEEDQTQSFTLVDFLFPKLSFELNHFHVVLSSDHVLNAKTFAKYNPKCMHFQVLVFTFIRAIGCSEWICRFMSRIKKLDRSFGCSITLFSIHFRFSKVEFQKFVPFFSSCAVLFQGNTFKYCGSDNKQWVLLTYRERLIGRRLAWTDRGEMLSCHTCPVQTTIINRLCTSNTHGYLTQSVIAKVKNILNLSSRRLLIASVNFSWPTIKRLP